MSHTDKDRPYWVKLNDKGNPYNHDHLDLGKVYYRRKAVLDDKGNQVYEDDVRSYTAYEIVHGVEGYFLFRPVPVPSAASKQARRLIGSGQPYAEVSFVVGQKAVYEMVHNFTMKDYCTEGEKVQRDGRYSFGRDMPCTPELPGEYGYSYDSVSSKKRQFYRDKYNGHNRTTARNTLRNMTKAANSGEDEWEDDFEEVEYLTAQHRHSIVWDLW